MEALLARAERGEHAASDFLEDALIAGVPPWAPADAAAASPAGPSSRTSPAAAAAAVRAGRGPGDPGGERGGDAYGPVGRRDPGRPRLVRPALSGYMGPLRVLLSDLWSLSLERVQCWARQPFRSRSQLRRLRPGVRVAVAELQPVPLADVRGKDAFFATTANPDIAERLGEALERMRGAAWSACRLTSANPAAVWNADLGLGAAVRRAAHRAEGGGDRRGRPPGPRAWGRGGVRGEPAGARRGRRGRGRAHRRT